MYEPIWQAVKGELSGERASDFTARLWEHARWNSFDRMRQTAAEIAAIMREIGLADAQVLEYPADGLTAFGGWVMPEAWDVEDATLEIIAPPQSSSSSSSSSSSLLSSYRSCPMSLFMYSAPTPPEGIVAEVVPIENAAKPESFEGRDVRGRIVLTDGIGLEIGLNAFARGAVGVLSDVMRLAGSPQEKAPGHFDHACQWHNYTVPPWKTPKKGFGFALSPANGRRLREMLKANPSLKLRAVVKTRLYTGVIPLATGLLPGETSEEIAVTGHLCEPGANDNNSGCALGLEAVRAIKALADAGKLPRLKRGIRIVHSFEVRGYQAFLANWPHLRRLVAGLNLDMVGNDLSDARARANLLYNWAALPAYADAFALELMRRLVRDDPLFRFRTEAGALVDNLFGEPAVGAPTPVLGCWPDAYYHTSLDTIEHISPRALAHIGRIAATYCAFLATAGLREADWLARLALGLGKDEILQAAQRGDPPDRIEHLTQRNLERIKSAARLVRTSPTELTPNHRGKLAQRLNSLARRLSSFAQSEMSDLRADLRYAKRAGLEAKAAARDACRVTRDEEEKARKIVPKRLFRGSLCFEALSEEALRELTEKTGLTVGWGAPQWLQLAMFRSTGKRTAWDVWHWLRAEGCEVELPKLNAAMQFLAAHGFVKLRHAPTKADTANVPAHPPHTGPTPRP